MMGQHPRIEPLFHYFRLEDQIPDDHLLKRLDRSVDFRFVRERFRDAYSPMGRPSIDPEILLRPLLVGYLYGISSERRLVEEVRMHLAYRWFTRRKRSRSSSTSIGPPTAKRYMVTPMKVHRVGIDRCEESARYFFGKFIAVVRPSLLQRQRPDTINIQVPFGTPPCYPFWNRRAKLLIETECVLRKLLRSERSREVMHRRSCGAKRLAELALQVSLHALRFDGLVLDHRPHSVRRIDCWHLPPANLNQEILSSFSCARFFYLLRHRFEYAQSPTF